MNTFNFIAFDLGATSGRAMLGVLTDGTLELKDADNVFHGIWFRFQYSNRSLKDQNALLKITKTNIEPYTLYQLTDLTEVF